VHENRHENVETRKIGSDRAAVIAPCWSNP